MRKLLAASTIVVLMLLLGQSVYAQYGSSGTLTLSTASPEAGAQVRVSGTGFLPDSDISITIHSDVVLLASLKTDGSGAFSADVTIPSTYAGSHEIVASGIAPDSSVRVLSSTIDVASENVPAPETDAMARTAAAVGTHPVLTAFAVIGVLVVSAIAFLVLRRRSAR